jgi:hypothetical protein
MVYRGDERVAAAKKMLDDDHLAANKRVILSRGLVECKVDPALNWVLTTETIAKLRTDAHKELGALADVSQYMTDRGTKSAPSSVSAKLMSAAKAVKGDQPRKAADKPTKDVVKRLPEFQQAPNSVKQSLESRAELVDTLNQFKLADPAKLGSQKK